jgi:hypothetical protein
MRAFFRRLFGPPPPPAPRLVAVVNRVDDLEARLEYIHDELKQLRGRVTGKERKARPEPVEEPAEGASDGQPEEPAYRRPAPPSTAYLARRFRRF